MDETQLSDQLVLMWKDKSGTVLALLMMPSSMLCTRTFSFELLNTTLLVCMCLGCSNIAASHSPQTSWQSRCGLKTSFTTVVCVFIL